MENIFVILQGNVNQDILAYEQDPEETMQKWAKQARLIEFEQDGPAVILPQGMRVVFGFERVYTIRAHAYIPQVAQAIYFLTVG